MRLSPNFNLMDDGSDRDFCKTFGDDLGDGIGHCWAGKVPTRDDNDRLAGS